MVDNQLSTVDRIRESTAVITKPKLKSNLKNKSILVINKEHTNKDINQSQNTNNDHQSKQVRFENVHDSNTVVTCTGQIQGSVKVKGQQVAELARDSKGVVYQESVENARDPIGKQGAAGVIKGCEKVRNQNSAGGLRAAEETNEQKCRLGDSDVKVNIIHKVDKVKENSSMINQKACMKSVIAPDNQINEKKHVEPVKVVHQSKTSKPNHVDPRPIRHLVRNVTGVDMPGEKGYEQINLPVVDMSGEKSREQINPPIVNRSGRKDHEQTSKPVVDMSGERGPDRTGVLRVDASSKKGHEPDNAVNVEQSQGKGLENTSIQSSYDGWGDYDDYCSVSSLQENNMYIINRVRAVSMRAPIQLYEQNLKAVIDTGAEVTVISKRVFDNLPVGNRPTVERADHGLVVAEKDKKMGSHGMAKVTFSIGDKLYTWPMYIADIYDDLLLGADFLDYNDVMVSLRRGLYMGNRWIQCMTDRKRNGVNQVVTCDQVVIPAEHEMTLLGRIEGDYISNTQATIMLEPVDMGSDPSSSVMIGRVLVDTSRDSIPIKCVNVGKEPLVIDSGQVLGELKEVEELVEIPEILDEGNHSANVVEMVRPEVEVIRQVLENPNNLKEIMSPQAPDTWHHHQGMETSTQYKTNQNHANIRNVETNQIRENINVPAIVPDFLCDLYKRSCEKIEQPGARSVLAQLLSRREKAFAIDKNDLGRCALIKHKINTGLASPVRAALRRTPPSFEGEETKHLKQQLDSGVLIPSKSPWASAVVLVRKKNGEVRWCGDYRPLNARTVPDAHPLPRVDMCMDALATAKLLTTLDLQSGYWNLELDEERMRLKIENEQRQKENVKKIEEQIKEEEAEKKKLEEERKKKENRRGEEKERKWRRREKRRGRKKSIRKRRKER